MYYVESLKDEADLSSARQERLLTFDGLCVFLSGCFDKNITKFNKLRDLAHERCPLTLSQFLDFSQQHLGELVLQQFLSMFDLLPKFNEVLIFY
jgi:hypothetical protein